MHTKVARMLPVLLLCCGMAHAEPTEETLAEYRQAGVRFSQLVADAEASDDIRTESKVSVLRTAEFSALVEVLSDEGRLPAANPDSIADIEIPLEICGTSNKAVMALVLFDLKANASSMRDVEPVMALEALMRRNTLAFQRELTRMQPFLLRCLASQMEGVGLFLESLPAEQLTDVRRGGVRKMRGGISMTYQGTLNLVHDPAIPDAYREVILATMAELAAAYADVIPLSERKFIVDATVRAASTNHPRFSDYVTKIEQAFRSLPCSSFLCGIE